MRRWFQTAALVAGLVASPAQAQYVIIQVYVGGDAKAVEKDQNTQPGGGGQSGMLPGGGGRGGITGPGGGISGPGGGPGGPTRSGRGGIMGGGGMGGGGMGGGGGTSPGGGNT